MPTRQQLQIMVYRGDNVLRGFDEDVCAHKYQPKLRGAKKRRNQVVPRSLALL